MVAREGQSTSKASLATVLFLVQVFFGFHYIGAKIILEHLPPLGWASLRIMGAVAVLVPITLATNRNWPVSLRDHGRLALYALFGVAINQTCFVEGLSRTLPSHSALINTMIPVATLIFAILLKAEKAGTGKITGIAVAMGGVLYLLTSSGLDLGAGVLTGDLLTLVNSLSFSFFLVISKPILARYPSMVVTSMLLLYGGAIICSAGAWQLASVDFSGVPAEIWVWAGVVILFSTVGAYALNAWALKRADSSLVAIFIYVQPLIGSGLSVLFLGEKITLQLLISAALIFGGVYLVLRPGAGAGKDATPAAA